MDLVELSWKNSMPNANLSNPLQL